MGTSLNGLTPAGTYPGLIKTGDNAPIDGTLKTLSDGNGNNLPMAVSTTTINLTGTAQVGGVAIANTTQLAAKQDTLVSGTNIKTINGTSLLGSGNIPVVTSPSGVSGAIQFSNGSAFASDAANLFWDDTNNRLGVGTNAPSTTLHVKDGSVSCLRSDSTTTYFQGVSGTDAAAWGIKFNGGTTWSIGGQALGAGVRTNIVDNNGSIILAHFSSAGAGFGTASPSARVQVVGSGSTSATTSLLVQNSAGRSSLQVLDDTSVFNYGGGSVITNTAYGQFALQNNSTGSKNVALSYGALLFNTTGSNNTAVGFESLRPNTTGSNNTALGDGTRSGDFSGSLILGKDATATANNQFVVGSSTTNAGAIDSSAFTQDKRWKVKINGVDYYIALQTA